MKVCISDKGLDFLKRSVEDLKIANNIEESMPSTPKTRKQATIITDISRPESPLITGIKIMGQFFRRSKFVKRTDTQTENPFAIKPLKAQEISKRLLNLSKNTFKRYKEIRTSISPENNNYLSYRLESESRKASKKRYIQKLIGNIKISTKKSDYSVDKDLLNQVLRTSRKLKNITITQREKCHDFTKEIVNINKLKRVEYLHVDNKETLAKVKNSLRKVISNNSNLAKARTAEKISLEAKQAGDRFSYITGNIIQRNRRVDGDTLQFLCKSSDNLRLFRGTGKQRRDIMKWLNNSNV